MSLRSSADATRARRVRDVSIHLFGSFTIELDGEPVDLPLGAQRLVALLGLRGCTGRGQVAGLLWPHTVEERALANLRTSIWRANQAASGLVEACHGAVQLGLKPDVDTERLIALSRVVLGDRDRDTKASEPPFVTGELLPDWGDPWLVPERERLHQLRLHVLEAAAEKLTKSGCFGLALEAALAALRADDLRESAHRAVILIHLAEGNLVEAQRAYDACRRTLIAELGIEPSNSTSRLMQDTPTVPTREGTRPPHVSADTAS